MFNFLYHELYVIFIGVGLSPAAFIQEFNKRRCLCENRKRKTLRVQLTKIIISQMNLDFVCGWKFSHTHTYANILFPFAYLFWLLLLDGDNKDRKQKKKIKK